MDSDERNPMPLPIPLQVRVPLADAKVFLYGKDFGQKVSKFPTLFNIWKISILRFSLSVLFI